MSPSCWPVGLKTGPAHSRCSEDTCWESQWTKRPRVVSPRVLYKNILNILQYFLKCLKWIVSYLYYKKNRINDINFLMSICENVWVPFPTNISQPGTDKSMFLCWSPFGPSDLVSEYWVSLLKAKRSVVLIVEEKDLFLMNPKLWLLFSHLILISNLEQGRLTTLCRWGNWAGSVPETGQRAMIYSPATLHMPNPKLTGGSRCLLEPTLKGVISPIFCPNPF